MLDDKLEFIIDSNDRISGTSSDYKIQLKENIRLRDGSYPRFCKLIGIRIYIFSLHSEIEIRLLPLA